MRERPLKVRYSETGRTIRGLSGAAGRERSVQADLLIGHPVNDAVVAGVHVPQVVGDGDDGQDQGDHQPEHDVEDHRVLEVVLVRQVVLVPRVRLRGTRARVFMSSQRSRSIQKAACIAAFTQVADVNRLISQHSFTIINIRFEIEFI